jgi:hypothetical protein
MGQAKLEQHEPRRLNQATTDNDGPSIGVIGGIIISGTTNQRGLERTEAFRFTRSMDDWQSRQSTTGNGRSSGRTVRAITRRFGRPIPWPSLAGRGQVLERKTNAGLAKRVM